MSFDDLNDPCLIIGAGPAGLTAAYEAMRLGIPAKVFEKDEIVGGISRTANYRGYRFDIGGHRFFTKVHEVEALWHEILGSELIERPRLSRIYYDDKFFDYPIRPVDALIGLGPVEAVRIAVSYLKAQVSPSREEDNLEQWVTNRFGRRLYEIFFKTYTEKVWGMPCSEIGADWAAQRIKNLDLATAVKTALLGSARRRGEVVTSLIDRFLYPRLGPGMLWERCQEILEAKGYPTVMGAEVARLRHDGERILSATIRDRNGVETEEHAEHFISSMPIRELLRAFEPAVPAEVLEAANSLRYRDFLTVALIVDQAELFPDNWIYIHSPKVRVGRIQNFKQWSPELVPDASKSSLGLEYFVQEGDDLWTSSDESLVELARRECAELGLIDADDVLDGCVVRMPKAYPVYDSGYQATLDCIRTYLERFSNLQLVGRNGQHRYNNQDHSMATAMYAVRNIAGARYDVWDVNVEQAYHEQMTAENVSEEASLEREVPTRILDHPAVASAFARYDPLALGVAVGAVVSTLLFAATATLLLRGGDPVGPNLSLLGQFLWGYDVSWRGAFVGLAEAALGGFAFGAILAGTINKIVAWHERAFTRRIEFAVRAED